MSNIKYIAFLFVLALTFQNVSIAQISPEGGRPLRRRRFHLPSLILPLLRLPSYPLLMVHIYLTMLLMVTTLKRALPRQIPRTMLGLKLYWKNLLTWKN